jgi:hypothetical protein
VKSLGSCPFDEEADNRPRRLSQTALGSDHASFHFRIRGNLELVGNVLATSPRDRTIYPDCIFHLCLSVFAGIVSFTHIAPYLV